MYLVFEIERLLKYTNSFYQHRPNNIPRDGWVIIFICSTIISMCAKLHVNLGGGGEITS